MNRLLTPKFEEAIKDYPLYSQDGKARDAVCVAIFTIGNIRWFVLEGGKEGDDTILYCIVVGLGEDEYGYVSLKELADVELDYRKQGLCVEKCSFVLILCVRNCKFSPSSCVEKCIDLAVLCV